jgi:hypothetical protein
MWITGIATFFVDILQKLILATNYYVECVDHDHKLRHAIDIEKKDKKTAAGLYVLYGRRAAMPPPSPPPAAIL